MRHVLRRAVRSAAVSLLLSVCICSACLASGDLKISEDPRNGGYTYFVSSVSRDRDTTIARGRILLDAYCPGIGSQSMLVWRILRDGNGNYAAALTREDFAYVKEINRVLGAFTRTSLPLIVKEGTPVSEALTRCAQWVADVMSYDGAAAADSEKLAHYQDALPCFAEGKGVCTTYAAAFNVLVSALPFSNRSGLVDYRCKDASHLQTRYFCNADHGWSGVLVEGQWRFYDVTFYDNNDGERLERYLYMGSREMEDGYHSGCTTPTYIICE